MISSLEAIMKRLPFSAIDIDFYDIATDSANVEKLIDKKIAQLKRKGVGLENCRDYLKRIVDESTDVARCDLERQHSLRNSVATNLYTQRASDKEELLQLRDAIHVKIKETEAEYKSIETLYLQHNPLYNGRLLLEPEQADDWSEEEH